MTNRRLRSHVITALLLVFGTCLTFVLLLQNASPYYIQVFHNAISEKHSVISKIQRLYNGKQLELHGEILGRPVEIHDKFTKVLLMTQERGGSTYAGGLFMASDDAVYWFEPEYGFYTAMYGYIPIQACHPDEIQFNLDGSLRKATEYESVWMTTFATELLNNHLTSLPPQVWDSPFMTWYKDHNYKPVLACTEMTIIQERAFQKCGKMKQLADYIKCYSYNGSQADYGKVLTPSANCADFDSYVNCRSSITRKIHGNDINRCGSVRKKLQGIYDKKKVIALKMHRLRMANIKSILEADPKVKVIHYVRDPRGILSSRKKLGASDMKPPRWAEGSWRLYAAGLCTRMSDDFKVVKKLSTKYPNTFITLRYEDLVKHPTKYAQKVYNFLGHKLPKTVSDWLNENTHHSQLSKEGVFDVRRRNGTATAYAWKHYWSESEKDAIGVVCYQLLRQLGYPVA